MDPLPRNGHVRKLLLEGPRRAAPPSNRSVFFVVAQQYTRRSKPSEQMFSRQWERFSANSH
jgi:hypothetical protein